MSESPPVIPAALLADLEVPEHERWAEYSRRKGAWERDNPSAYSAEHESFCARLAEELGL